jgi:hypothetical protein
MPLMGALFTTLVLAASGLPAGTDVTTAPGPALVAGIDGAYRTAAYIILVALVLAVAALWIDTTRKRAAQPTY